MNKTIITLSLILVVLLSGCANKERLTNACNYCGYEDYTDYTYNNNYNSWWSKITLVFIECDGEHQIDLYDGVVSQDKWGNRIIEKKDVIFCD